MARFSKFKLLLALKLNLNGGSILQFYRAATGYFKNLEKVRIKLEIGYGNNIVLSKIG